MIVYDDSVKTRRPVIFMQPDWRVSTPNDRGGRMVAGQDYIVLMADMFGAGYGSKPKTVKELAAGMSAVHNDLAFTIACSNRALEALLAEANKLGLADTARTTAIGYCAGGGYRSNTRAPGWI